MTDFLNTPHFNATGSLMAAEESLDQAGDWTNIEAHPRDPNCEIRYGVQNGEAFFQKIQKNMEMWLDYCKARRDQYEASSMKDRTSLMGLEKYALPAILVDDFNLRGVDVSGIMATSDHSEIDQIMMTEYPMLLCIPMSAMRKRVAAKTIII